MLEKLSRIVVIAGHYGSGKTNLAVNLALDLSDAGRKVTLVDLDIVNPYFRSADFAGLMQMRGIGMVAPVFARSNLDLPALDGRLDAMLESGEQLVIDVGGDDAGAMALGRYSAAIGAAGGCDLLCVVNGYRYLTRTSEEAAEILEQIERASRLKATAVVNCSNLAEETDAQIIAESMNFAQETADRFSLPMLFTAAEKKLVPRLIELAPDREIYPVEIYVKKPWEV